MGPDNDLFHIIYTCRAMRRLKSDPVPEDVLIKLVDAAHQGPTGSNRQNARWVIVRDPGQKARLAALNRTAVEAYVKANTDPDPKMQRLRQAVVWQKDHFHEMPALIVACLELASKPNDSWAAGAGAGGSVWPGIQNLLLAARALGLGATITTLGLSDRPAARKVLGLPDLVEPVAIVPVGYPTGRFGPVSRRPLSEVLHWDRW